MYVYTILKYSISQNNEATLAVSNSDLTMSINTIINDARILNIKSIF